MLAKVEKKYYDSLFKLQKFVTSSLGPVPIDTLVDILGLPNKKEFVDFYVENSLTGIDIDWSTRKVVFDKRILEELENLLAKIDLNGLFK